MSREKTSFSKTYGTKVVIPAKIGEPSFRSENFDPNLNDQGLSLNLDILEIRRDKAQIQMVANQQAVTRSYNGRVKIQQFQERDLVLKKIIQKQGAFSPN